jgi:hypothetical protein
MHASLLGVSQMLTADQSRYEFRDANNIAKLSCGEIVKISLSGPIEAK